MTNYATQILLVSEQAAPNLLPALDPIMKPQEVVMIVTKKMEQRAVHIKEVLREAGVKVHIEPLDNEHDFHSLQSTLYKIGEKFDKKTTALNVTGGNKLMALIAHSVAEAIKGWSTFYVDVDTDQIIWLEADRPAQALSQSLRLNHYLRGYGFTLTESMARPQAQASWESLAEDLVHNIGTLENSIGTLNFLSQKAKAHGTLKVNLESQQKDSRNLEALLRKFEEAGVLSNKGDFLIFDSEDARSFANGGWFEHHVFQSVSRVADKTGIRDKAFNLKVENSTGQKNEMDVAFMARNRLFVIECKTAKMNGTDNSKANDTLYKLAENCRRIGGLGTKGMLATYRPLSDTELKLAGALRLECIHGQNLARMDELLKRWIMNKS